MQAQSPEYRRHVGLKTRLAGADHATARIDQPQVTSQREAFVQARPLGAVRSIIVNRQQPEAGLLSGVAREHRKIATQRRHAAVGHAQDLDLIVAQRMLELGIPDHQIGRPDPDSGGRWRAFIPHQGEGGGVVGDQINVDAGLLDVGMMRKRYGPDIGGKWASDRLRDRLDQVIAHEYAEAAGISHQEAVQRAPKTPLAIHETARERLRAIADAEKRGEGRSNL
jgi:hypothetical protein